MEQKIILVTGGNRGIGLAICKQLADMDHKVIMGSRDLAKGKKAAESIKGDIHVRHLDVTKEVDIKNLAMNFRDHFGKLDVLINNAGLLIGNKGTTEVNIDEVKRIMEANFYGPWRLSQVLLPLLKNSKEGRIINMSSAMGAWDSLTDGYAGYRLSKTSLNALTVQMANELSASGIKVNAMSPGWVRTDMGGEEAPLSVDEGADTATWLATAETIPTGKFFRDRQEISW